MQRKLGHNEGPARHLQILRLSASLCYGDMFGLIIQSEVVSDLSQYHQQQLKVILDCYSKHICLLVKDFRNGS